METPRQRWWTKAQEHLAYAQDLDESDAYRAAEAAIAVAYLNMVGLTFVDGVYDDHATITGMGNQPTVE